MIHNQMNRRKLAEKALKVHIKMRAMKKSLHSNTFFNKKNILFLSKQINNKNNNKKVNLKNKNQI